LSSYLCNDKKLAKELAVRSGFCTPPSLTVSSLDELPFIRLVPLPLVVKPNADNGSVGVIQDNLVRSYSEAEQRTIELLSLTEKAVMCETFSPGKEVYLAFIFSDTEYVWQAAERFIVGEEDFFFSGLYDIELKKMKTKETQMRLMAYPFGSGPTKCGDGAAGMV
jgi:D-alanine-D-alanine ligase-like ATP-grasp enzyme